MSEPRQTPAFVIFCIDKNYDALTTQFLATVYPQGFYTNYFYCTTAGAGLSLAYKEYIKKCRLHCPCESRSTMEILRESVLANLSISQTLFPVSEVYILNHQSCGAIRAFLDCASNYYGSSCACCSCARYPKANRFSEKDKSNEIEININLLIEAKQYILDSNENISKVTIGLIDLNGTVYNYSEKSNQWFLIYEGEGNSPNGLWFDYDDADC